MTSNMAMQPKDAAEVHDMFFQATAPERALILHNLAQTPLKAAPRIPTVRTRRAIQILEMAAFAGDIENFTLELGDSLILPSRVAAQIVDDTGGEALAVAARARHAEPQLPAHLAVLQAGDRHVRGRGLPAVAAL